MKKPFVICLIAVPAFAVGVVLLACRLLTGTQFNFYAGMVLLGAFALHGFDRLKEFDLRSLKLSLAEAKGIRDDIYAKAAEVRAVMEDLADSYVSAALQTGELSAGSMPYVKDMLQKREHARSLLTRAGLPAACIAERLDPVTAAIGWQLIIAIRDRAQDAADRASFEREHPGEQRLLTHFGEDDPELNARVIGKPAEEVVPGVEAYIRLLGLQADDYREELQTLRYFAEHDALPEPPVTAPTGAEPPSV